MNNHSKFKLIDWTIVNRICFITPYEPDLNAMEPSFVLWWDSNYSNNTSFKHRKTIYETVDLYKNHYNMTPCPAIYYSGPDFDIILEGGGTEKKAREFLQHTLNITPQEKLDRGILLKNSYFNDKEVRDFLEDIL